MGVSGLFIIACAVPDTASMAASATTSYRVNR